MRAAYVGATVLGMSLNLITLPAGKRETVTKDSQPAALLSAWDELLHPNIGIGDIGQLRRGEIPKMRGYRFEAVTLFTGGASLRVLGPPRGLRRRRDGLLTILVAANPVLAPTLWRTLRAPEYDSILPFPLKLDLETPPLIPWCAALTEIALFDIVATRPNGSRMAEVLMRCFARLVPLIIVERSASALRFTSQASGEG